MTENTNNNETSAAAANPVIETKREKEDRIYLSSFVTASEIEQLLSNREEEIDDLYEALDEAEELNKRLKGVVEKLTSSKSKEVRVPASNYVRDSKKDYSHSGSAGLQTTYYSGGNNNYGSTKEHSKVITGLIMCLAGLLETDNIPSNVASGLLVYLFGMNDGQVNRIEAAATVKRVSDENLTWKDAKDFVDGLMKIASVKEAPAPPPAEAPVKERKPWEDKFDESGKLKARNDVKAPTTFSQAGPAIITPPPADPAIKPSDK